MSNITKLYLLNVPLEADYKHTLFFNSSSEQENYFKGKSVGTKFTDFSYQRKDNKIRVPKQFDEINGKVNYVMYQNTAYNNKWFYAFITNIQYVSDGVTDVFIKTDVIQTWFFDYNVKSCFVEREHTKDDTVGKNTLPEGLETGEYICNNVLHDNSMDATCYIVASTVDLFNTTKVDGKTIYKDSGLQKYNGVITGWYYYYFDAMKEVEEKLNDLETLRTNDAIVSIFIMPSNYVYKGDNHKVMSDDVAKNIYWGGLSQSSDGSPLTIYKPNKLNGYKPKNNKLLSYPYSYLLMDNNAGASAVYRYELFNIGHEEDKDLFDVCDFIMYGAITPSGSIKLLPLRYAGVPGENNNYSLTGGKFPICGWQSDYYTNWLTQNALNIEVQTEAINLATTQQIVGAGFSGVMAGFSRDVAGAGKALSDGIFAMENWQNQIKGINAQKEMHAFQSPTVRGNVNSGDVDFVRGNIRFSAYQMSIKEEYAKIIDNYFSMYGYQTNRVKTPNKNHRSRYWYTKTVGCDIAGAIPNEDMQIIKACYDNGITFWKNPNDVGVYTDSNNELIANTII